jgi:polyisoprenoid-binding protein YceI
MRTPLLLALLLCASPALAQTPPMPDPATAPAAATVLSAKSGTVTYHLVHKLHKFDGVCKQPEGKVRILPNGKAQVMVRAKVESFDSGNSNRDSHMKETVEAARFPTVELKATGDAAPPTTFPATVERTFHAEVTFHGVPKSLDIPVQLTYESATSIKAKAHFILKVEDFKIERPSLMFVKIDNDMPVDVELTFAP